MKQRHVGLFVALAVMLVMSAVPAMAHDPGTLGGDSDRLKGRTYDGNLGEVSPGGVPYEALSDIRCEDGMAGIFPCHKVDLASFMPLPDLEATFINDVWGWTDPLTGMQVAIAGTFQGTAFVDVTDGINPVYLGTLPTPTDPNDIGNIWGDIRVYENTAYVVSEAIDFGTFDPTSDALAGFGIQIVDLEQFRNATGPIEITEANRLDDIAQAHNVALNTESGRMYVAGSFAGLNNDCAISNPVLPVLNGSGGSIIYDVETDPLNPTVIGCLDDAAYNHDVQCVTYHGPDSRYTDHEICIGSNESHLAIYDATDPEDPEVLARAEYLDLPFFDPDRGVPNYYTHQGWLTEDHAYFFLGDELDEFFGPAEERTTYLWDMGDLENPEVIGVHTDGNTSIDHNMFVHDDLLYQSNYSSGLWIYDTWKVEQGRMTARGYFDIFPANDVTDFFGTWGNYPYFGDGKVVVTSSDEGLFVLQSRAKSAANDNGKRMGGR
jgi:choice-of-anchor B domain-containing protein